MVTLYAAQALTFLLFFCVWASKGKDIIQHTTRFLAILLGIFNKLGCLQWSHNVGKATLGMVVLDGIANLSIRVSFSVRQEVKHLFALSHFELLPALGEGFFVVRSRRYQFGVLQSLVREMDRLFVHHHNEPLLVFQNNNFV